MSQLASPAQLRGSLLRAALVAVPLIILLGTISGRVAGSAESNPWFQALVKPDIYPPGYVFGIAWTILYALMGVAVAMVWSARGATMRWPALLLFVVQLAANLAWSPLFFREHRIEDAFWLIVGIGVAALFTTIAFFTVRRLAALLMLPYLAWLGFAGLLNWRIHELNPDGGPVIAVASVELALPRQE